GSGGNWLNWLQLEEIVNPQIVSVRRDLSTEEQMHLFMNLPEELLEYFHIKDPAEDPNILDWRPEPLKEKHFACVDEETECLTLEAWKRHSEIRRGDLIAAYSLKDEKVRWAPVTRINRYLHDGEMIHARAASLDMLLTPNHRCVVQLRDSRHGG